MKRMYEEYNVPAFVLDGALDFCRVALAEQEKGQPPIDMSYPCETMYRTAGNEVRRERKNQEGMEKGCYIGR